MKKRIIILGVMIYALTLLAFAPINAEKAYATDLSCPEVTFYGAESGSVKAKWASMNPEGTKLQIYCNTTDDTWTLTESKGSANSLTTNDGTIKVFS